MSTAQEQFQAEGGAASQCEKILDYLQERVGQEVSMYQLYLVSGAMACHSRIADLRKRGHRITNRTERLKDGTRASYYTLHEGTYL